MRVVIWSAAAGQAFDAWISHLVEHAGAELAARARADVTQRVARLDAMALAYRRSQLWPGLHELSLQPWHKLVVYSVEADRVDIAGFYDMRQDLAVLDPHSS